MNTKECKAFSKKFSSLKNIIELEGEPQRLSAILEFSDEINVDEFLSVYQQKPYKGQSLLWLLLFGLSSTLKEIDDCLLPWVSFKAYEKFMPYITLKDLLVKAEAGENKGKSVLWILAEIASSWPNEFMHIWRNNEITIKDLRVKAMNGPDKGISILWLLAYASYFSPKELIDVWKEIKSDLTLADLSSTATKGEKNKMSVLWMLACTIKTSSSYKKFLPYFFDKFEELHNFEDISKCLRVASPAGEILAGDLILYLLGEKEHYHVFPFDFDWNNKSL